jgi:hypothetical protein
LLRDSWDDRCSHNRHHAATDLERQVWKGVSGFLSDPERMRQGLEELVAANPRRTAGSTRRSPTGVKPSRIEVKSERLLDLYLEGTLEKGRYEERTRRLEAQEKEARAELEKIKACKQTIEQAGRDVEGLIESYSAAIPDELERLEPEERHRIYKMLSLHVKLANGGIAVIEGAIAFPQNRDHVNSGCR